jgi:VWFA-related protein
MKKFTGLHILIILSVIAVFAAFSGYTVSQAQTGKTASPKATPTPEQPVTDDDEPVKIDTELVNVLFTAADSTRRFITDLKKEDVRILEDGQPQQIFTFNRQVDLPLSLAVLIDTSGSQERTLPEEKEAAKSFLDDVVRPNKDEVAILSFTGETTLEQGLTGNVQRLHRAVDRVEFIPPSGYIGGGVVTNGGQVPGTPPISGKNQQISGSTAIWDAIWVASHDILNEAPMGTRRAIILISDGVNTYGSKNLSDAVNEAIKSDALIYCVGIGDDFYQGVNEGAMKKLSESTGGRAYFPRNEAELRHAFTQIQLDLRSQYLLAYQPSNSKKDGGYRKIQIEVTNPAYSKQKIKLIHRQGYFAKTADGKVPKK